MECWSVSKVQVSKLSLSVVVGGGAGWWLSTTDSVHQARRATPGSGLLPAWHQGAGPFSALLVNVFQDFIQLIILTLQLNHSTDIFLPKN